MPEAQPEIPGSPSPASGPPGADPGVPTAEIFSIRGWRRLLLWPLALVARIWNRTLRFEISEEDGKQIGFVDTPVVFVTWHNRLFVVAEACRRLRPRPFHGLVSASRDGAWLAAFLSLMGIGAIRGSSSRFGREAAARLVQALRAGHDVGITPDGPRGPCYNLKPGLLVVARRAQAPLMLFGVEYATGWRLPTWDGFYLPAPFSRVRLRCRKLDAETPPELEQAAREVAVQLAAINPDR